MVVQRYLFFSFLFLNLSFGYKKSSIVNKLSDPYSASHRPVTAWYDHKKEKRKVKKQMSLTYTRAFMSVNLAFFSKEKIFLTCVSVPIKAQVSAQRPHIASLSTSSPILTLLSTVFILPPPMLYTGTSPELIVPSTSYSASQIRSAGEIDERGKLLLPFNVQESWRGTERAKGRG